MAGEQQGTRSLCQRRGVTRERSDSAQATHHKGGVIAAHLGPLAAPSPGLVGRCGAGFPRQGRGTLSGRAVAGVTVLGNGAASRLLGASVSGVGGAKRLTSQGARIERRESESVLAAPGRPG